MTNFSPWAVAALAATVATTLSFFLLVSPPSVAHAFAPPSAARVPPAGVRAAPRESFARTRAPPAGVVGSALLAKRETYNPLKTLLGDMASSLLSTGGSSSSGNPKLEAALSSVDAPSWNDVRTQLESNQTPSERSFRSDLAKGYGPPSPLHQLRLYDSSNEESDVRVTLYRDSASWCPYCQKVWTMLEEKRIPYKVEKINMRCYGEKPSSFTRLQPSGNIPVAIIDGVVYNQSNDIMYVLEEKFPDHKRMSPDNDEGRRKANELLRLERQLFSVWMYWLTGSGFNGDRFREQFEQVLGEVESELSSSKGGDFFLGKDVSIVDMMYVPFLERMCASLLFYKGYQIRVAPGEPTKCPSVNKWFDAMETLDSYRLTKSDYYTHCWDLPPQLGGCTREPGGEPYEMAINGERSIDGSGGSWDLPLQKHNGGVEPDWDWAGDDGSAKREAVERVSANHENIVSFAARGAGKKGFPGYSAPLADPNAVPNDGVKGPVDVVLRAVMAALLDGTEEHQGTMDELGRALANEGGLNDLDDVVASLAYLRDRIGVPRDMKLPAARQLRAHLNWAIGRIFDAKDGAGATAS